MNRSIAWDLLTAGVRRCSARRELAPLALLLAGLDAASAVAALGAVRNSFPFQASDFVSDPIHPHVYASVPGEGSVAVINTNTATVSKSIPLQGSPSGMAISPDGQTLYVANSTRMSIDVIDTQTLSLTRSITLGSSAFDVAVGLSNRLYIIDSSLQQIRQIDALTGRVDRPEC